MGSQSLSDSSWIPSSLRGRLVGNSIVMDHILNIKAQNFFSWVRTEKSKNKHRTERLVVTSYVERFMICIFIMNAAYYHLPCQQSHSKIPDR